MYKFIILDIIINNPKISSNIFWKFMILFFKNFGRVSPNLAYLKLSTKSTSVPNQPFPQFNVLIILQHISINNISLSLIIILLKNNYRLKE